MGCRIGIVKEIEPGGYARVMTERKTVCGECNHTKIICYGCILSPHIVGRVANPVDAGVGDTVNVCLSDTKLFISAGMFYLFPVVLLLTGALAGMFIADAVGISENAAALVGAVTGLLTGMVGVTALGRLNAIGRILEPRITAILSRNAFEAAPEQTTTLINPDIA